MRCFLRVVRSLAVFVFVACCYFMATAVPVWAADRDDGKFDSGLTPTTTVGDTIVDPQSDGSIVITMTAQTATNSWRWRTIGFYVTDKKLLGEADARSLRGSAGGTESIKNVLWLNEGVCKTSYRTENGSIVYCPCYGHTEGTRTDLNINGVTKTEITISAASVEAHLRASGIKLKNGKANQIYLQGILGFYNGSEYKYGPFYSVDQARAKNRALGNGRDWTFFPRSSGEGWVKRYDIGLEYCPKVTNVLVMYYKKNTKADKEAGATTTWSRVDYYTTKSNAEKWISCTDSFSSLAAGNGLGFPKNDYYEGEKIQLTAASTPRLLSKVREYPGFEDYYIYRLSWSKRTDPISDTTGIRAQNHVNCYTGVIVDKDGVVTQEYKDWLIDARKYAYSIIDADRDLVLNICYKKPIRPVDVIEAPSTSDHNMIPHASAVIQSDPRGADTTLDVETYDSEKGIPSSEPQYVNVYADNYLHTVSYVTRSASKSYSYHEGCYEDSYTVTVGEGEDAHEETYYYWVHGSGSCTITCTWEDVYSLGIWKIDHSDITNKSLPHKTEQLYPHGYTVNAPDVVYNGGVVSWSPYGTAPCGAAGAPDASQTYCKSGRLVFNGKTVLSDAVRSLSGDTHTTFPAAGTIGNDVLYENGYVIPPTLANDEYRSKGKITYKFIVNTNTSYGNTLDYDINKINDVTVHTPTVSYSQIPTDDKQYCQLVTPSSNAQLVLDRYFTVCDSSFGYHSDLRGYGTRNYTKNANQFIARKEVLFPFDVYECGADGSPGTFYPSGTWITLDLITGRGNFYLPIWVSEGNYTVSFRSRTINCDANVSSDEEQLEAVTEVTANTFLENYLSSATIDVEVSGRLFDLSLYDISDYPAWGTRVFRQPSSTNLTGLRYTVGLNDRNGSPYRAAENAKYTFSLVDGSHPYLKNYGALKPGYVQRFYLTTFGDMYLDNDYVDIRPTFYYISGSGDHQVRKRVNLYYDETIDGKYEHFVKVGSDRDKKNIKNMSIGDLYTSVPSSELSQKAALLGCTVADLRAQTGARYRYDRIVVPLSSATFVGDKYIPASGIPAGVDETQVKEAAQKWYFEYSLPANVHAVPVGTTIDTGRGLLNVDDYAARYGIDYTEDFWCSGGYIVVNWNIRTVSSRFGESAGGEDMAVDVGLSDPAYHLSYINSANWPSGFCNMWNREGYQYEKTDSSGRRYTFLDGDILMFYASSGDHSGGTGSGSVRDDYKSYGTH